MTPAAGQDRSRPGAAHDSALQPPGLIWGRDFVDGERRPVEAVDAGSAAGPPGGFRWLHLGLADQRVQRWLAAHPLLPAGVRELLLSAETHGQALVEGEFIACVLPDLERDFDAASLGRAGVLRFALGPSVLITARLHPVASGDVIKRRIDRGAWIDAPDAAFDLLAGAVAEVVGRAIIEVNQAVQAVEDAMLDEGRSPEPRSLATLRRRTVQLHRQLDGLRAVFRRLEEEEDEDLPEPIRLVVAKLAQRFAGLQGDIASVQGQLRLVVEEMDIQSTQRTNQNLYILSILTALMLPATLVTGIFGMNTGGLPFAQAPAGTAWAAVLAASSSFGVYLLLRLLGFFRR